MATSKHLLDNTLTIRGTRHGSTHQWRDTSVSHQEASKSLWTNFTHQGETPEAEGTHPAACEKATTNRKVDKLR